jgi:hypothetical protein
VSECVMSERVSGWLVRNIRKLVDRNRNHPCRKIETSAATKCDIFELNLTTPTTNIFMLLSHFIAVLATIP